ncbi:hypothetical protein [Streptomyces sp. NPDC059009]|uniref:hypothetical protein n=1 Tax=Streptomyces sp. NPDC059009 TaxID=3346694 RepID=UPI0036A961D8
MARNTELLVKIRDMIREHPEQHDQDHWAKRTSCGTTYCIAGWAAVLTGAQLDWIPVHGGWSANTIDNEDEYIEICAQRVMGLSDEETDLFCLHNAEALLLLNELIEEAAA